MTNLITGQRDTPEQPPATRVNPFADYVSQNPRVAKQQQAAPSADHVNGQYVPVPNLHHEDDDLQDLQLPTATTQTTALFSEQTVTAPFMMQP